MKATFLRKRGLGNASVSGIIEKMETPAVSILHRYAIDEDTTHVIRWGTVGLLNNNTHIYFSILNQACGIRAVANKKEFRMLCSDRGLSPQSWDDWTDVVIGNEGVIGRPSHHSQGRHLYHINDLDELEGLSIMYPDDYYVSEYIPKVAEYRVYIVQGRAVAVAEKRPENPSAIAWNHSGEAASTFYNVKWNEWNLDAVNVAIQAFNLTTLDFGGVDVIVADDGVAYVLEINSAPSVTTNYRQRSFAKAFDWIMEKGGGRIDCVEDSGWKGYIHPAVSSRAIVEGESDE